MYVRQVGNQVGLYDSSNREYCRVNGKLVSYNSDLLSQVAEYLAPITTFMIQTVNGCVIFKNNNYYL